MSYIRHDMIGGTAACILAKGDHFGNTPYSLWQEILHEEDPEDLTWKLAPQIGIATEQLNADFFTHKSGLSVLRGPDIVDKVHHHAHLKYMVCQPDGVISHSQGRGGYSLFEAKHVNVFKNMGECIEDYYPQLQHNMCVMDVRKAYLSVIFGNQRIEYEIVDYDEAWMNKMMPIYQDFWNCVVTKTAPEAGEPVEYKLDEGSRLDMTQNNAFGSLEFDWVNNKAASDKFKEVDKEIKALAPKEIQLTTGKLLEIRRDKAGRAHITTL